MVTDFSAEVKASGVKFFYGGLSASWAENLPFWGTLLPRNPKSDEAASYREVKFTVGLGRHIANVTLEMRHSWNMARHVDVGRHVWI